MSIRIDQKRGALNLQIIARKTMRHSMEFTNVTVHAKANLYFEGRVISHTVIMEDGSKKTIGVILPGTYHFGTQLAERMELVAGEASVTWDDTQATATHRAGEHFDVAANSGFTITVSGEPCEYVCSFLKA